MKKMKTTVLGILLAGGLMAAPARADFNLADVIGVVGTLTGGPTQTFNNGGYYNNGGNDLTTQVGGLVLQQLLSGGLNNLLGGGGNDSTQLTVTEDLQMAPLPNSSVTFTRPTVQVNFPGKVRTDGVRLAVDGRDVTSEARVESRMVRWVPTADLAPGTHHVYLEVLDRNNQLTTRDWTFTVAGQ